MDKIRIFAILLSIGIQFGQAQVRQRGNQYELLSGVRNAKDAKSFWDKKYNKRGYIYGKAPAKFLAENYHYLKERGSILDMGMGEGRNAVFLASKGFKVTGVDISSVAVKKARRLAKEYDVRINGVVASLSKYKIPDNSFDAIICFYYVDRSLHKSMMRWLKPGGLLIYESHTDLQKNVKGSEKYERRFLLREGELLSMFKGMRVLKYEEPLHNNEFTASIILAKRK